LWRAYGEQQKVQSAGYVSFQFQTRTMCTLQAVRTVDPGGRSWNRLKTAINQPHLVSDARALVA